MYKEAAGLGYTSLCIPEEFGGAGLGTFANILVAEEFARADAGFSVAVQASTLAMKPILLAGTKEQKQYAADALINGGMGSFLPDGAGRGNSPKGFQHFLLNAAERGLSIGKHEDKMGIRLSTTADVILEEVHVPEDHLLGAEEKDSSWQCRHWTEPDWNARPWRRG